MNGHGYELCKILLCTWECSGLVLCEGRVTIWQWQQRAEGNKTLGALERWASHGTPWKGRDSPTKIICHPPFSIPNGGVSPALSF